MFLIELHFLSMGKRRDGNEEFHFLLAVTKYVTRMRGNIIRPLSQADNTIISFLFHVAKKTIL